MPNKNNLTQFYSGVSAEVEQESEENRKLRLLTCAEYNMSIYEDMAIIPQHRLITAILNSSSNIKYGTILLKVN